MQERGEREGKKSGNIPSPSWASSALPELLVPFICAIQPWRCQSLQSCSGKVKAQTNPSRRRLEGKGLPLAGRDQCGLEIGGVFKGKKRLHYSPIKVSPPLSLFPLSVSPPLADFPQPLQRQIVPLIILEKNPKLI